MEFIQTVSKQVLEGLKGSYGTAGLYGSFLRVFITFGLLSGPASSIIDAPFGRAVPKLSSITVDGNWGWMIMEIVSPLSFLIGFSSQLSSTPISWSTSFTTIIPSWNSLILPFYTLPKARVLLASLFLLHYFNRSILSTLRNPSRARMHLSVPISAVIFNVINGFNLGFNLSGGGPGEWTTSTLNSWGIQDEAPFEALFILGIVLWGIGFLSNIWSDEILYALKRKSIKAAASSNTPGSSSSSSSHWKPHRYSIPHGFLYTSPFGGISSPSYFSEWIEWTGFLLSSYSLAAAPFPLLALTPPSFFASFVKRPTAAMTIVRSLPLHLRPLDGWWMSPPALFLWNEISAMLPRALSTHQFYKKTFGKEYPSERKAIIPGVL